MTNFDSYVICTSPRSGSTLLCKLLAETGVAGNPASYFHRPSVLDWLAELNIIPEASVSERELLDTAFKAAIAEGSQKTGIFGLRLQRHSFEFFSQKLATLYPMKASHAQRFQAAFGRTLFIHLKRRDKIEQAVSYVRAQQTGLWHMAPDGTELERLAPHQDPIYDSAEIRACFERMTAYERDWEDWFESEKINPLRISYEALSSDPTEILSYVLESLGVKRDFATGIKPGVKKLADATSRDWAAQFRSELGIA